MIRQRSLSLLLAMALSLLSMAASPLQEVGSIEIAWWVWLIVISVFLLIAFVVFITLDWGDARDQGSDQGSEE
jgi:type VI protein secretion system component VasK